MNRDLISVILPVFNAEKYLEEAVGSVLAQTYADIELICINDHSTDRSLSVLQSFGKKINLIDSDVNCGTAESRNKGIRLARGKFLAFLDNDDVWEHHKLEIQMKQFQRHPDWDVSFTHMKCFISPELDEEEKKLCYCPPDPMEGYIPSTLVVKKNSFEKAGYFESKWQNGESVAWLFRAKEAGLHFGMINKVLVKRRIHRTNKGVLSPSESRRDYLKIIRESLARRKQNIEALKY